MNDSSDWIRWLICGASAGLAVDLSLYPLDTIKTRLQSSEGFRASGGFKNIYRGMSSVALGAAPGSALFFLTYSATKHYLQLDTVMSDALRASFGEVAACIVRVPTELIKQRSQTSLSRSVWAIARNVYKVDGFTGFYRGYWSMVAREIPFSFLEFPIWEFLKRELAKRKGVKDCSSIESAACGSVAGAIAAGLTTPLDVAKTRIMLETRSRSSIAKMVLKIARNEGLIKLFSGVYPRMCYLSLGAFVFFGAYEFTLKLSYKLL